MTTLNWQQKQFPNLPDPRSGSAIIADVKKGSMMLFGGVGSQGGRLNDTWMFDQDGWRKNANSADIPGRSNMGFAYDNNQNVLVLFGGRGDGKLLGDTWIFDGNSWQQHQSDHAPSPRAGARMAFDSQRKTTVLFGGENMDRRFTTPLGDTWLWDGSNWQQGTPDTSPDPRNGMSMAYDASRQAILLFGGHTANKIFNDTWVWNGSAWKLLQPLHAPSPRTNAAMVYNPTSQLLILFGGQAADGAVNDTWVWDGQDWAEIETETHPPLDAISAPQICYLPAQDNVMLLLSRIHKPRTPSKKDPLKVWSEVWVLA